MYTCTDILIFHFFLRYELVETILSTGIVSEILIRQADRRDSALFSCIAVNAYGRDDTNIQLIVQEPPDGPQDVRVLETTSRSVKLSWSPPQYNGNTPITQYIIQYRDEGGKWHNRMTNVSVTGTETSGMVTGLKPAKIYLLRVLTENRIGRSEPSKPVEAITQEEAPGAAPIKVRAIPTSSQSIKVSWKPPTTELQHGLLKGYYVGYKIADTPDTFVYKTLEIGEGFKEECHVTGLRRNTKYSVVVQAFNSKGAGPPSDDVVVQTLENDPPLTPPLTVMDKTTSSIHLAWDPNYDKGNPVSGYVLHHKHEDGNDWVESNIAGDQRNYLVHGLECGTKYHFFLLAYNSAGKGEPGEILVIKTEGGAPLAPDKQSILSTNMTAATMNLVSWHDGGCPIKSFKVRYRQQQDMEWTVLNDGPLPSDNMRVDLVGLSPGSWYQIHISATNKAGTTDAEYTFSTLNTLDAVTPKTVVNKVTAPFYLDMTIILPVAVSGVVISVVLCVVCVVVRKKHSSEHYGTGPYQGRKGSASEAMRMSEMEKNKKHSSSVSSYYPQPYATTHLAGRGRSEDGTDSGYHQVVNHSNLYTALLKLCMHYIVIIVSCISTGPYQGRKGSASEAMRMSEMEKNKKHSSSVSSYYPQPYATTHLAGRGRSEDGTDSGYHQLQEEPLYATVKRTPRPPRSDGHIYHCPGLLMDAEQRSQNNTTTSSKDGGGMRVKLSENDAHNNTSGEDDEMLMQRIQKYLEAAEKVVIPST
nr:Down syndrome cell adhesion molecule-like [Parasteatoda tepidariorum]